MRKLIAWPAVAALYLGLYGAAAVAADGPAVDLTVKAGRLGVKAHAAVGNPTKIVLQSTSPVADIRVSQQLQSTDCLLVISQWTGVCVPPGPGVPVSPD
ncbi:MAG: hypothetical protein ACRETM_10660 [Stenotrophobium sp.]